MVHESMSNLKMSNFRINLINKSHKNMREMDKTALDNKIYYYYYYYYD